jgi:hypothetical protein
MKVDKRFLTAMNRCYAANHIVVDGQVRLLLATEGEGPCLAWSGPDYTRQHVVWDGPGGTMTIVPIAGTNGEFLAVQKFFRMFQWDEAKIVHVRPLEGETYAVRDLLRLPYIHRFDLLPAQGRLWFLGSTLATHKDTKEDWSRPGQVWVGEYRAGEPLVASLLKDDLSKNHGYCRMRVTDHGVAHDAGLVAGEQGVFEITPPQSARGAWQVRQLMDWPVSDIAAVDIDGDGELEFATIEPFHGSHFRIYKRSGGRFERVFEHPEVSDFYHVVVGTTLRGRPVVVGGCRRGKQQLFYVQAKSTAPLELEPVVIDEGVGPANVHVLHEAGRDVIVAANREKAEAALYFVT